MEELYVVYNKEDGNQNKQAVIFPRELMNIVRRKFLKSQEIMMEIL